MKFSRELIKGSTKSLVLAVLNGEELYGYQIVKAIKKKSGEALEFGEGSIYPALHALEKEGLLTSHWVEQTEGPNRKYYALTRKGKGALKQALAEWTEFRSAVDKVYKAISIYG